MNLLILEPGESGLLLPRSDRRYGHVRKVLGKKAGDRVAAGLRVDSPFAPAPASLGEALVARLDETGIVLDYAAFEGAAGECEALAPIRLILGFPRPIQAGRIFKDLASLGVADIVLTGTALGEKSYLESSFFKDEEWRAKLVEGAEQAANPRLPRVSRHWSLARCLGAPGLSGKNSPAMGETTNTYFYFEPRWEDGDFIVLHPGEGRPDLGSLCAARTAGAAKGFAPNPVTLAIGSERGWTGGELDLLREAGFITAGLGKRILKTETATLAAVALVLASLGRL